MSTLQDTYATVLMRLVGKGQNPKDAIHSLSEVMARRGHSALLPKVTRAVARIAERAKRTQGVVLTIANKKDENNAKHEIASILKDMGIQEEDIETRVDETLIGGWRLEGRERLIDASHKNALLTMYEKITRA